MLNVEPHVTTPAGALAALVREHLDALCTYATHLVGDADDALEFATAGLHHATRYPPARLRVDGRVALYRAVTSACRTEQRYPPRPSGAMRLLGRRRTGFHAEVDARAAERINTVKRALMTVQFDRRASLLLRDLVGFDYREIGRALECSPEQAARLLAGARRDFGTVYREIAL